MPFKNNWPLKNNRPFTAALKVRVRILSYPYIRLDLMTAHVQVWFLGLMLFNYPWSPKYQLLAASILCWISSYNFITWKFTLEPRYINSYPDRSWSIWPSSYGAVVMYIVFVSSTTKPTLATVLSPCSDGISHYIQIDTRTEPVIPIMGSG